MNQHITGSGAPEADGTSGMRRAALEIANRRAQELRAIKEALCRGDGEMALRLMCEFFGIPRLDGRGNRDKE